LFALVGDAGVGLSFMLVIATAVVIVVVGVIGLMLRLVGGAFRLIFGIDRGGQNAFPQEGAADFPGGNRRICPDVRCGHKNPWAARYCAQCGRLLRRG
jgi:hypothetical protein